MYRASLIILVFLALVVLPACGKHGRMGHHDYRDYAVQRATQQVSALIDESVKDPENAKQAKEVVGEIVAEVKHSRQQNRQFHQQLYDLNASYDAEPEAFLKVMDEANVRRMQSAGKILGLRFKLKRLMTEQEWKAVTDGLGELRSRYRRPEGAEGKGKM